MAHLALIVCCGHGVVIRHSCEPRVLAARRRPLLLSRALAVAGANQAQQQRPHLTAQVWGDAPSVHGAQQRGQVGHAPGLVPGRRVFGKRIGAREHARAGARCDMAAASNGGLKRTQDSVHSILPPALAVAAVSPDGMPQIVCQAQWPRVDAAAVGPPPPLPPVHAAAAR